jgi:hypothetical protein
MVSGMAPSDPARRAATYDDLLALNTSSAKSYWEGLMPRGQKGLSIERLREMARAGAETTLKQLRAEIIAIERTFPELALPKTRRAVSKSLKTARKRTTQMSAAARKAVSVRMKKYWVERRKARVG